MDRYKTSRFYWINTPKPFASFYRNTWKSLSPTRFVSSFLESRTKLLFFLTHPDSKGKLLDAGCGSAVHLVKLAPKFKQVIGVDYSDTMLRLARENMLRIKLKNWRLINSDAVSMPIPSHELDVVVAMGLLDYVSSPKKVLLEFRRILKNSGYVVFGIPKNPSTFNFLRTPIGIFFRRLLFKLPPIDNVVTLNELLTLLDKTGFSAQHITPLWDAMWMVKAKCA